MKNKAYIFSIAALLIISMFNGMSLSMGRDYLYDEAVHAHILRQQVEGRVTWEFATHNPQFNWLAYIMTFGGRYEPRYVSVFFGMLMVAVVALISLHLFGEGTSMLSAFIFAVMPFQKWYSAMFITEMTMCFFTWLAIIFLEDYRRNNKNKSLIIGAIILCFSLTLKKVRGRKRNIEVFSNLNCISNFP